VVAADGGLGAGACAGLGVHFDCEGAAGCCCALVFTLLLIDLRIRRLRMGMGRLWKRTSDFTDTARRSRTTATEHIRASQASNGAVVFDGSHTGTSLVFGADPEFLPSGVGGDGCRGGKEDGGVLHVDCREEVLK
jgi:hypothetical protein